MLVLSSIRVCLSLAFPLLGAGNVIESLAVRTRAGLIEAREVEMHHAISSSECGRIPQRSVVKTALRFSRSIQFIPKASSSKALERPC